MKLITEKVRFRGLSRGTFAEKSPLTRSLRRAKHFLLPRSARGELKNSPFASCSLAERCGCFLQRLNFMCIRFAKASAKPLRTQIIFMICVPFLLNSKTHYPSIIFLIRNNNQYSEFFIIAYYFKFVKFCCLLPPPFLTQTITIDSAIFSYKNLV